MSKKNAIQGPLIEEGLLIEEGPLSQTAALKESHIPSLAWSGPRCLRVPVVRNALYPRCRVHRRH